VVKFIVDKEGRVSEVEALSGPTELREEAMRVVRKSGNWIPAIQNGRNVKSYKSQAIVFRLESQ
jgi:protein TonB